MMLTLLTAKPFPKPSAPPDEPLPSAIAGFDRAQSWLPTALPSSPGKMQSTAREGSPHIRESSKPGGSRTACEELFHRDKSLGKDLSGHKPLPGKRGGKPRTVWEASTAWAGHGLGIPSLPQPQNNLKKLKPESKQ